MKVAFLSLGLAAVTSANIIFNHVALSCDQASLKEHKGCLRGQICNESNECESLPEASYPLSFRSTPRSAFSLNLGGFGFSIGGDASASASASSTASGTLSTDGTCGAANGGTVCDPDATSYTGSCCSQYGWCGNDDAHCGDGCQSGDCSSAATATSASVASVTAKSGAAATTRADGMCGSAYGGATCDANGPYGGCCSQYGYCGKTSDHCLASSGCQSGCTDSSSSAAGSSSSSAAAVESSSIAGASQNKAPSTTTTGEPVIAPVTSTSAASSSATGVATTDGTCGSSNNNTVCGNWPNGNCCSMYGFCGSTSAHCGDGCQSGNCTNTPSVSAPGPSPAPTAAQLGEFNIVGRSGAPAMHLGLMPNGKVFVLDKVENYTEIKLANGQYAYSTEYSTDTNTYVPLAYKTNAFCSGGVFLANGSVVSLGGNAPLDFIDPTVGDGFDAIRYLSRSSSDASLDGQDWSEPGHKLASKRWYATAQTMPDGKVFVASGSLNGLDPTVLANNNPTYEMLSAEGVTEGVNYPMEILEKNQPYYMYPFVHLLSDGSLFVFVSKSSERFSTDTNTTLSTYPDLPGDYRTYPNTGASVLLPLSSANNWSPDVIICGGGAYQDVTSPTDPSCGRISPLATTPAWEMDSMPEGRGQVEGTLLPDGTVIFLNGGNKGSQGFNLMIDPTFEALLYTPSAAAGQRFETLASSTIPRLYHSVATLLLDGTLMVTGSNPVEQPLLEASTEYPYVTEFRVENYVPPYLQGDNANKRPTNVNLSTLQIAASATSTFTVTFTAVSGAKACSVVLYHGGFVTHSLHMGHRMLVLDNTGFVAGSTSQTVTVTGPKDNNVAPPGPYVIYVLVDGVPAVGQFVMVS